MNVFLTGGTGFIGKALVHVMARRGWRVTALVRNPYGADAKAVEAMGARLAVGDIYDRSTLTAPMRGADVVIHNAGRYEFGLTRREQQEMKLTNVQGVENVLGEAAELGAARIVHVSSIVAHGRTGLAPEDESYTSNLPPLTAYEDTKAMAHQAALRYWREGAPVVIASPAGVVGPGDHSTLGYMSRMYVRGVNLPLMSIGVRATVHLDDCAEAIALAAEKGAPGEEYILSGGDITTREMFEVWKTVKGGPKFSLFLPRWTAFMLGPMEPLQRLLGLPNIFSREVFLSGSTCYCYSGAKAERELGAQFRSPRQAWRDALEAELCRLEAGRSWRDLSAETA